MIPVFTCRGWDSSVKRLTSNYGVYVYLVVSDSFETPWTVTCHAPLSMEFSRQEYCSELPFRPPDLIKWEGSKLFFSLMNIQLFLLHLRQNTFFFC